MLRTSSIKAFVISNIINLVLPVLIVTASAYVMIALRVPTGATILMACLSVILSSLISGFVAGRIAECRPVLHGALSASFILIAELYALFHSAIVGRPPHTISSISLSILSAFAALLFGALGGYGAARGSGDANRYSVAPVQRTRFVERGLIAKLLLSLVVTACVCAFILFSPTIFCHGGGAGGNCGEAYMLSIPAAMLALPIVFAGTLFLA
ncbi:hypothetical protein [Bradyrhizobium sp.]|uniref:hypothetical protein n=1 Tax=Bradyrhizobium sp. TaxID=376 RepID=UPI0039E5B8A6